MILIQEKIIKENMKNVLLIILVLVFVIATAYYIPASLASLLPLLTAIISAAFAYYFSRKKELELKISDEKRRRYEKLIFHLKKGFFDKNIKTDEKIKYMEEYYEESYVVWLYASDEVIRNLNDFARVFSTFSNNPSAENNAVVNQSLGKTMLAMRKDIRGNTSLLSNEFITTDLKLPMTQ